MTKKMHIKMKPIITQDHIKSLHKYIFEHGLQDIYDKKIINPDDTLQSQLNPLKSCDKSYTYYNLKTYIKSEKHIS